MKKTVVLGVASGIAAFKSLELVKQLRNEGIDVIVIQTETAVKMVPPAEFEKVSGHRVLTELFEKGFDYRDILKNRRVDHIDIADKADLLVIAPATANIIAKLANGIADDFLTTTALAVTSRIVICPSMNVNMWNNPMVQNNIEKLRKYGYIIIGPGNGMLACGYTGAGRLAEIADIKDEIMQLLGSATMLRGKKVIVTSGGTREKIDDVRYITNRSSGKMGVALAEECYLRGADVLLIRAKGSAKPRYLINEEVFTTVDELLLLVKKYVKDYHYFYHTAAVSDFKVRSGVEGKLSSSAAAIIVLEPQLKILNQIKVINPQIHLIGFKAEYTSDPKKLTRTALLKLKESRADVIVANDVSKNDRGFESDKNEVYIVTGNGAVTHIPLSTKRKVAESIVNLITTKF